MADWLTDDDAHHFGNCIRVLIFCGLLKGKFDYTQIEQKEDVVYTSNALIKLKKPDFICSWAQTFRIYGTSPHQIAIDFEHVYGIMTALPPSSPFPPLSVDTMILSNKKRCATWFVYDVHIFFHVGCYGCALLLNKNSSFNLFRAIARHVYFLLFFSFSLHFPIIPWKYACLLKALVRVNCFVKALETA